MGDKRNIKNKASTRIGRFALSAFKFAGIGVLTATQLAAMGSGMIARNGVTREILCKAGGLVGGVAGLGLAFGVAGAPIIMISGMKMMLDIAVKGKVSNPLDLTIGMGKAMTHASENIMGAVLDGARDASRGAVRAAGRMKKGLENLGNDR